MGFPDPAVSTGFVHQLLSAHSNIVGPLVAAPDLLCRNDDWFPVAFAARHQGPDHSGRLVCQRDRGDLGRAPSKQLDEPRSLGAVARGTADDSHGPDYQHLAQVTITRP